MNILSMISQYVFSSGHAKCHSYCGHANACVPRIRIGRTQTIETLINEETLSLAKFLRDERKTWTPRIAVL